MQPTTRGSALALESAAARTRGPSGWFLVALAPLVYAFMPRPPISGAHRLVFPLSAAVVALLVLHLAARRPAIDRRILEVLVLLLLGNVAIVCSFWLNASDLRSPAILELLRPGMLIAYLLAGYYVAQQCGDAAVRRGLLQAAQYILIGQAVIAAGQIAGVQVFDLVYSEEKARPLGSLLRVTGSLGNPNAFGWIVAQATLAVLVLGRSRRLLWLLLGAALVLASGSRSTVLIFPFVIALGLALRRGASLRQHVGAATLAAVLCGAFVLLVFTFSEQFRYLAQVRQLAALGSIDSINSVANRLSTWVSAYNEFRSAGGVIWSLGLGSRELTRVMDNDYLYVLFRLGFVGLLLHVTLIIYVARQFIRARGHPVGVLGLVYTLAALLLGVAFETLGGWNFPLLFFYLLGLTIGLRPTSTSRAVPTPQRRTPIDGGGVMTPAAPPNGSTP